MKLASFALLGLLLAAPVMAQGVVYKVGERVEALNMGTGNWETATITQISAGRYMLRSPNSSIEDWDVGIAEIRGLGEANSAAAQPAPVSSSAPAQGVLGSGSVPGGVATTPADNGTNVPNQR